MWIRTIEKLRPFNSQFGLLPLTEIARRTGLTSATVKTYCRQHATEIEQVAVVNWDRIRARLGTEPDLKIAREHGLTRQRVAQVRRRLGIPVFVEKKATGPDMVALRKALGTKTDQALAIEFGIGLQQVFNLRKSLGIASYTAQFNWSKIDPLLGTDSDAKIALKTGLKANRVRNRRVELGIKAYRSKPVGAYVPEQELRGPLTSRELAERHGCGVAEIRWLRQSRNIKEVENAV